MNITMALFTYEKLDTCAADGVFTQVTMFKMLLISPGLLAFWCITSIQNGYPHFYLTLGLRF